MNITLNCYRRHVDNAYRLFKQLETMESDSERYAKLTKRFEQEKLLIREYKLSYERSNRHAQN